MNHYILIMYIVHNRKHNFLNNINYTPHVWGSNFQDKLGINIEKNI